MKENKITKNEKRLYEAIFGVGKPKFKSKEEEQKYELNCMTIQGYESLWRLFYSLSEEDREFYRSDFMNVQKSLIQNYNKAKRIEKCAKRIMTYEHFKAPALILNNEKRVLYEKVCKEFDVRLTEEELAQLEKEIKENEN